MTQYAKYIDEHTVQYPQAIEFRGIPNWQYNEQALRKRHYAPLTGEPEPRVGVTAEPSAFALHEQTKTRIEPRPYEVDDWEEDPETHEKHKTGTHTEWRDTEITLDDSYIEITAWTYVPIEPPEPAPLPTRFTKGTLLEALMACDLYEQAKAIYAADMDLQIAWAGFADIDLDYKATQDIMAKYPELFTEQNVQLLREWIRDHQ